MGDSDPVQVPLSGQIPYAVGQASVVRIPVPGTQGLCIEFKPRGHIPSGGSTSTLFIHDVTGRRQLRLDFGYNNRTDSINYHWNHDRVHREFKIQNHTPVGRGGAVAYQASKYFRFAGRLFMVAGAALDAISIVHANRPLRRASEVVAGWAGAWVGCKGVGAGGAVAGTAISPGFGTAAGGVLGCVIGGMGGYMGASTVAGIVYDWAENTYFAPVPEVSAP